MTSSVQTENTSVDTDSETIKLLDAPVSADATASIRDEQRTINAVRLFDFASVFSAQLSGRAYGRERPRRIRLSEPDGPSTAGGKLSRRSILFTPDDRGRDVLVLGWVDIVMKKAEVRSFESLTQYFARTFRTAARRRPGRVRGGPARPVAVPSGRTHRAEDVGSGEPVRAAIARAHRGREHVWTVRDLFWVIGMVTGFCLGYVCFGA